MLAEKNEINNSKRRNKGSVISIILVALLIVGIIFCSFILSDNQFVMVKYCIYSHEMYMLKLSKSVFDILKHTV